MQEFSEGWRVYLAWELVEASVHGQLQPLQALTAAQFLRNELDSVVAQQQLLELSQLPWNQNQRLSAGSDCLINMCSEEQEGCEPSDD